MDKQIVLDEWIRHVLPVTGDGEYVQGAFYVRLHDNLSVEKQEELINSNIEHCTFSKFSSTVETMSNNSDPSKICPGVKVFYYHTKWRRKLDGCEDRSELQQEYVQRQQEIVGLLSGTTR